MDDFNEAVNSGAEFVSERDARKAVQKKEKTNKAVNKMLAAINDLGNIGAKFDFTDDERDKIFACIESAVQKAKIKFDRNDEFSL